MTLDEHKIEGRSGPDEKAARLLAFNKAHYGDVIRAYRLKRALSQPQLAAILHTSKNYVSNWEVGRARPDLNMIPALCKALQITPSAFFGVPGAREELTYDQQRLLAHYEALSPHSRRVIAKTVEAILDIEDAETRKACEQSFTRIFRDEQMAAAGVVNPLGSEREGEYVYLRKDENTSRADEIICVSGDSMEPTYSQGDELLVQFTSDIRYGDICILTVNGEGFVKEYRGDGVYSHNSARYPFRKFRPGDDVRCIGRVLGKVDKAQYPTKREYAILEEIRREKARAGK